MRHLFTGFDFSQSQNLGSNLNGGSDLGGKFERGLFEDHVPISVPHVGIFGVDDKQFALGIADWS